MGEHDLDDINADHLYVDMIRLGQVPNNPDELARYLLAWRAEVERGLDEAFRNIRAALFGSPDGQEPATAMLPVYPAVQALAPSAVSGFRTADGDWYARISADELGAGHVG